MNILHAEKRKPDLSAKQLKKTGLIPGNVYGKNLDGSLLIQLNQNDVRQLLKSKTAGNKLTLSVDGQEYFVLIKDIGRSFMGDKIENLSFQILNKDEKVVGSARVKLLNKEKVSGVIQQRLFTIPYKALPSNLVEEVEIDLKGLPEGTQIRVADLALAQNEDIELLAEPEDLVLSIDSKKISADKADESDQADRIDESDESGDVGE